MAAPLDVDHLTLEETRSLPRAGRHVFAEFRFLGAQRPSSRGPGIRVPLRQIGEERVVRWTSDEPPRAFDHGRLHCTATSELLLAWVEVDGDSVEDATRCVYGELLALLDGEGYPHLLRCWNVVPDIHRAEPQPDGSGLERYRAFSRGRAEAFEAARGAGFEAVLPAASAVGSREGGLFIAVLAGRSPGRHLENPRQVEAWRYPSEYGPRPPSFARATGTSHAGSDLLLSGTASVVGHASVHPGNVREQTRETLRNLDVLTEDIAGPHDLCVLRVFLREAADAPTVEALLRERYGHGVPLLLLEADICREDLLVEIEGVAVHARRTAHSSRSAAHSAADTPMIQAQTELRYDAVVIGGAFAGASLALLLRRLHPDAKVLVVERQTEFDRKVGEATVEISGHFLCEVLALGDLLLRDHLPKHGLNYWFHKDGDETLEQMTEVGAWPVPALPSFLLDRAKLDEQLLEIAEDEGTEVWRPARVIEAEPGLPEGRIVVERDGVQHEIKARWILDASGRRRWLGQQLGLHEDIEALPTNAMWGRWKGVKDLDAAEVLGPDPRTPRIPRTPRKRRLCTNHFMGPGSWTWMIPLANGETSVGLVFDPRHYEPPKEGRVKETYVAFVRSRPGLRELMRDAELVEADFRSYKHLPYTTKHYMGEGYALVGDAASFLDPYYSPGLDHVSMSVYATARLVEEDLKGLLPGEKLTEAIATHDARFKRSIHRWFDALYRDKYEIFGDAELSGAAFYLDTALYYIGVVGPIRRDVDGMRIPVFGLELPQATIAYKFLAFYRKRLTVLARKRMARGVYGRKNRGWRLLGGTFGTAGRTLPGPFWLGMRLWLGAELRELNPFKQRRPRREATELRTAPERA